MTDFSRKLKAKYNIEHRYNNFGSCLRKIEIHGFRGINNLNFDIDYPITAISGLNGAGKSTLGQLAVCAYKKPTTATNYKRQYVKNFFPVSKADPSPISNDAKVIFHYETNDYRNPQKLTVSRVILKALPSEARKLLIRDENGVEINNEISTTHARSILSGGNTRELNICVEDNFAKTLLQEVIRFKRRELLKAIAIHDIGDSKAVKVAKEILLKTRNKAIAIRDADVGEDKTNGLFSFPGTLPPEKEVFSNETVNNYLKIEYDLNVKWILERDNVNDHHKISETLAKEAEVNPEFFATLAIKKYVKALGDQFNELTEHIEKAL